MKKRKVLKAAGIVFGVLLAAGAAVFINHRICLDREKSLLVPLGQLVEVDGAHMSVYSEGEGETTIVFLSGSGTCSPILDFRSLYSLLSDEYSVAAVERFGYGFSDVTDRSRDIDTVLDNTREALDKAGIAPPYVLCPHSMSGIEALYWAQKYPEEVSAIIGLDMAVPEAYENLQLNTSFMRLLQFTAKAGFTRIGNFSESDAIRYGTLTDREKEIYRAVFFTRTMTDDMINEAVCIKDSSAKLAEGGIPHVPMLLFCSDGSGGTGFDKDSWRKIQADFAAENGCDIIYLDCGHYIHDHEYVTIAEEIRSFPDK